MQSRHAHPRSRSSVGGRALALPFGRILLTSLWAGAVGMLADADGESLRLVPPSMDAGALFGTSVGVDDGVAIVGATVDDSTNGVDTGAAYLFDAETGELLWTLTPDDGETGDRFGMSVAIHSGVAVVGAEGDDDNGAESGSAYLFDVQTGRQLHKLLPPGGGPCEEFGNAVSIHGDRVVVAAFGDGDLGPEAGSVHVFDTATGRHLRELHASDGEAFDRFGFSVAVVESTAVVGATEDDDLGANAGAAYLFDVESGAQLAKLTDRLGGSVDQFGFTVGLSETHALVGVFNGVQPGLEGGFAVLFDARSGLEVERLSPPDGFTADGFGRAVALEGSTALVGAPDDNTLGSNAGSAFLFSVPGSAFLRQVSTEAASDGDLTGYAVAVSRDHALVGAVLADDFGSNSGAAYLEPTARASVEARNGSGVNAVLLGNVEDPVLGSSWEMTVDCSGHAPGVVAVPIYQLPDDGVFLAGGELLVDMESPLGAYCATVHASDLVRFVFPIPDRVELCGLACSAQAAVFGAPSYELSNALDGVIGY